MKKLSSRTAWAILSAAVVVALALPVGCGNPVLDLKIEALGGETEGVAPGEHHRPGQPCVLCHSPQGPASPEFVVGGTIFADRNSLLPVENAEVVLYDAVGDVYRLTSNCIGNFYLEVGGKEPQFPLYAEVYCPVYDATGALLTEPDGKPQRRVKAMASWIARDGSCASCHTLRGRELDSVGWIVCNEGDDNIPYPPVPESCAGKPPATEGGGS